MSVYWNPWTRLSPPRLAYRFSKSTWFFISSLFYLWSLISIACITAVVLHPTNSDLAVTLSTVVAIPGAAVVLLAGPQMLSLSSVSDGETVQDPLSFHAAALFASTFFFVLMINYAVPVYLLIILFAVSLFGAVELYVCLRGVLGAWSRGRP